MSAAFHILITIRKIREIYAKLQSPLDWSSPNVSANGQQLCQQSVTSSVLLRTTIECHIQAKVSWPHEAMRFKKRVKMQKEYLSWLVTIIMEWWAISFMALLKVYYFYSPPNKRNCSSRRLAEEDGSKGGKETESSKQVKVICRFVLSLSVSGKSESENNVPHNQISIDSITYSVTKNHPW